MPAGQNQTASAAFLAGRLAASQPELALEWTQSLESPLARERSLIEVVSAIGRTAPAAATQWVQSWPWDVPGRDKALRAAFSYWTLAEPDLAGRFLESEPQLKKN
jgi:hypothetical protein